MPLTEEQQRQLSIQKRLAELRAKQAISGNPYIAPIVPPVVQQPAPPAAPVQPTGLNYTQMLADRDRFCAGSTSDFLQVSKLTEGQHRIRFIIPTGSDLFYAFRRGVWIKKWSDEAGDFIPAKITSPLTVDADAYCPCLRLSKALQQLAKETTGAQSKRASSLSNDLYPKSEFLSNVLLYTPETANWTSTILVYGMSIYKSLVSGQQANVDATDILPNGFLSPEANFADAEHGRIVVIDKSGKGLLTKYAANISAKGRPITPVEMAACSDLNQFVQPTPVEEIENLLCAYFNVSDFEMLVANINSVPLPDPAFSDKAAAAPQQQAQPAQIPLPLNAVPTPAENNNALPTCVGKFGSPDAGFACESCLVAEDCADIQALSTP